MVSFQKLPIWAPKVQYWVHNTILFLEGFISLMFSENMVTVTVSFSVTVGSHVHGESGLVHFLPLYPST